MNASGPRPVSMTRSRMRLCLLPVLVALLFVAGRPAVGTAAPQPYLGACDKPSWVAAWALPLNGTGDELDDETIRVALAPNFGGEQVRVRLSNAFGEQPVTFADATVGLIESGAAVRAGTVRPLTFRGASAVTVLAGSSVLSDPVALRVEAFEEVAVSVYAAEPTGPATRHWPFAWVSGAASHARSYVAPGDQTRGEDGQAFGSPTQGASFVTAVDVYAPNDGVLAIFGDSITEGATWSTEPYSTRLARRLHSEHADGGPRLSVVNLGLAGNALMSDGGEFAGPSALDRFDRDVLAQSGVVGVVMMEGINDLHLTSVLFGEGVPTVEEFATAYTDIDRRVRDAGAELFLSPLTPAGDLFRPGAHSTPEQVERRHEINQWIRSGDSYDRRIDFDAAIRAPLEPNWIDTPYNSGDNLHPNDAGHQRMADSIDLSVFDRFHCGTPDRR